MPTGADPPNNFTKDALGRLGVHRSAQGLWIAPPTSVEGVLDGILDVGRTTGQEDAALREVVALRERLDRAAGFVNPFADGPPGIVLTRIAPLTVGGFWIPQLVERAGGRHPLNPTIPKPGSGAAAGPQMAERLAGPPVVIDPGDIARLAPEWAVICLEGLDLEGSAHAAVALARDPRFSRTPAAQRGRMAVLDGLDSLHHPARRLAECFEFLVGWLNDRPGLIPAEFRWKPLS